MSIAARQELVSRLVFSPDAGAVQRADLLDLSRTQTGLIALLLGLTDHGWTLGVTAVRGDHGDDSCLGAHSHANGDAVDCWPLRLHRWGAWYDAEDPKFARFLRDVSNELWLYQVGLAGSANIARNMAAAGPTAFADSGPDHIHLGADLTAPTGG